MTTHARKGKKLAFSHEETACLCPPADSIDPIQEGIPSSSAAVCYVLVQYHFIYSYILPNIYIALSVTSSGSLSQPQAGDPGSSPNAGTGRPLWHPSLREKKKRKKKKKQKTKKKEEGKKLG
jgi:hypothetical protein